MAKEGGIAAILISLLCFICFHTLSPGEVTFAADGKLVPLYDAAIKLRKDAQRFGFVKYMIVYAIPHSFSYVPPQVKAQRRERKSLN